MHEHAEKSILLLYAQVCRLILQPRQIRFDWGRGVLEERWVRLHENAGEGMCVFRAIFSQARGPRSPPIRYALIIFSSTATRQRSKQWSGLFLLIGSSGFDHPAHAVVFKDLHWHLLIADQNYL